MGRKTRIAIAHDYLTQRGGAEKVVLAMARAFPDSPIYTTLYDPAGTYPEFREHDIRTSPINRIDLLRENHRSALPVLPIASSLVNIDADVVIASSSGWSHGFKTTGKKIVYCYSPARWLYQQDVYLGSSAPAAIKWLLKPVMPALKLWDRRAAQTADKYFAISSVVQSRISETYGIESEILPAPQSLESTQPSESISEVEEWSTAGFYLCISRLLPYKNVDKVIQAFNNGNRKLVVVGSGPQEAELAELAGANVLMVKNLTDGQIQWLYERCAGLVTASYEDFGLTPLEAAYYGKPSAALRWGGFLDTVSEGVTGVYFDRPDPMSIADAVTALESNSWERDKMDVFLEQFSEEKFAESLISAIEEVTSLGNSSFTANKKG